MLNYLHQKNKTYHHKLLKGFHKYFMISKCVLSTLKFICFTSATYNKIIEIITITTITTLIIIIITIIIITIIIITIIIISREREWCLKMVMSIYAEILFVTHPDRSIETRSSNTVLIKRENELL